MKNFLIMIGIIFGFLIINFFSIKSFYNNFEGSKLYESKNFSGAIKNFKKAKNYIGLYNLGNSNYKLGELEKDNNKKIVFWEKALENYIYSMKYNYAKRSEENYIFVKNKLEDLNKKLEQEKKQEKNKSEKNNDLESQNGEESQKNSQQEIKNYENGKEQGEINQEQKLDNLSKQQQYNLEQYEKQLKIDQKQNSDEFNKVYENNIDPFDSFEVFFGNSFFDNTLLDSGNNKKDW